MIWIVFGTYSNPTTTVPVHCRIRCSLLRIAQEMVHAFLLTDSRRASSGDEVLLMVCNQTINWGPWGIIDDNVQSSHQHYLVIIIAWFIVHQAIPPRISHFIPQTTVPSVYRNPPDHLRTYHLSRRRSPCTHCGTCSSILSTTLGMTKRRRRYGRTSSLQGLFMSAKSLLNSSSAKLPRLIGYEAVCERIEYDLTQTNFK